MFLPCFFAKKLISQRAKQLVVLLQAFLHVLASTRHEPRYLWNEWWRGLHMRHSKLLEIHGQLPGFAAVIPQPWINGLGVVKIKLRNPKNKASIYSSCPIKTRKRFAVLLKIFQINLILCLFLFHSGSRWRLWFATFTSAFLGSWLWILEFCYLCIQSFSNRFLRIPFNPSFPRNLGGSIGVIDSSGDICWGDRKGPMRHYGTGVWWSSAG